MLALHLVIFVCIQLMLSSVSAISYSKIIYAAIECEQPSTRSFKKEQSGIDYFVCMFRKLNAINSDNSLNVEVIENMQTTIAQYSPLGLSKSDFQTAFPSIGYCSSTASNTAEDSVRMYFQCVNSLPIF
ncbi:GSCOCT00008339001.3-RA-CDS [Cotesia congregata]|uniref:Odorant binding protein 71.8339 n=1 Tax=Cotesia congregata TaxID=51543 RepID=A0A8J2HR29_COTCN|nr:GSCOCT00008339001.3-RA-CDS [Cotesia congregata]CAG5107559.1 Odorant binding protein 71.8339 [Cotesia congregata]